MGSLHYRRAMNDAGSPPADWYPDDPDDPGHQRFWDGSAWTGQTRRSPVDNGDDLTLEDLAELQRAYGRPVAGNDEDPGRRFEYRLDTFPLSEESDLAAVTANLNARGLEGWELIGLPSFERRTTMAVWKRELRQKD